MLHNNALYALTTGQASPATRKGVKTKSTPNGNPDEPSYPLALAIASGATFAARAFSGDMPKLTDLIIEANNHHGLSVIDVVQPCITFGKDWSHNKIMENIYYLDEGHDQTNKEQAFMKAMDFDQNKIPLGIFYKVDRPSYESQIPQIAEKPLVDQEPNLEKLNELFKKYI
jgi:2-oxoglutarate ferredoxin oxidoreductase subunit beta